MKLKYSLCSTPFAGSTLYVPAGRKPCPGILLLHGSEGGRMGWNHAMAEYFAAHGFVALALSWCGEEGCPKDIIDVPLELAVSALSWLKQQARVSGQKIGLYGSSRGAEQALLISTEAPCREQGPIADVLALHAPTDVIVEGFSWNGNDRHSPREKQPRAWTWNGCANDFEAGKTIMIERFSGAVFISHGERDLIWSAERSKSLVRRRISSGLTTEVLFLPDQGHWFGHQAENLRRQKVLDFFHLQLRSNAC